MTQEPIQQSDPAEIDTFTAFAFDVEEIPLRRGKLVVKSLKIRGELIETICGD